MSRTSTEELLSQMADLQLPSNGSLNSLLDSLDWQKPVAPPAEPPRRPEPMADGSHTTLAAAKPRPAKRKSPEPEPAGGWSLSLNFRRAGAMFWLFGLTLVPLAFSLLGSEGDVLVRLMRSIEAHPELAEIMESDDADLDDLLGRMPDNRIEGAHLVRSSWLHWGYALAAAGLFFGLTLTLFQRGRATPMQLLIVGVATATGGILCLLIFQWIAAFSQVMPVTRGIVGLILLIVKLIGFSYRAALDPSTGLMASMLGFTFGVGLCEELVKAAPILIGVKNNEGLDWRGACVWGVASGVGFGVAEGIMYSGDYYNGVQTYGIYFVRFISCVGLHAIWAASVGIMVYHNQDLVSGDLDWAEWGLLLLKVQAVPMVLHGLYDTLLKKEYNAWALVVALISFVWLAFLISQSSADEEPVAAGAK